MRFTVFKGKRRVYRSPAYSAKAGRPRFVQVPLRRLKSGRGVYRVKVVARTGTQRAKDTLYGRRL